jgi:hypothetical protein
LPRYLVIKIQVTHKINNFVDFVKYHTWNCLLSMALSKSVFVFTINKFRKVTEEGYNGCPIASVEQQQSIIRVQEE